MSSYVWTDRISTGTSSLGISILSLPFHSILSFLESIGLTPFEKQVTLFFVLLAVSGSSVYYLTLDGFAQYQRDGQHNVGPLFASLFYVLNPYSMIYVWNRNTVGMNVSYAIIPLALALYLRGLKTKKWVYIVYTSFLLTVASIWVAIVPILLPAVLLSFLVFWIFISRKDLREVISSIRYSGLLALLWILLNMWFVFYFATNLSSLWWGFSSNYSQRFLSGFPIFDVIRLNFNFSSNGVFWPFYQTFLGVGLGAIMVASVLGGLIMIFIPNVGRRMPRIAKLSDSSKMIAYYSALSISGLFLGSVALTPLKPLIQAILQPLPLSASISNNMIGEKAIFLSALGYSVLFGLTISILQTKLEGPRGVKTLPFQYALRRAVVGILLLSVLVLNVWPMWTGELFAQPYLPSASKEPFVNVPGYYAQTSAWLNTDPSYFRVLTLPFVQGGITYDWQPYGYSGSTTDYVLLPKPMIMEANDPTSNSVISAVSFYMSSGQMGRIPLLLSLLSVKYLMVHEDVNFTDRKTLDPALVESALNSTWIPYLKTDPVKNEYGHPIASSSQDWAITWGTRPGSIENASAASNVAYVDYSGHSSSDGLGSFGFGPTFPNPLNFSNAKWLDISIQTSVPGTLFIAITDVNGRQTFFDGRSTPQYSLHSANSWSNFTLPFEAPSYTNQNFDIGRIRSILIAEVGLPSDISTNLKVKDMFVDQGAIQSPVPGINFSRRIGKLAFYEISRPNSIVYPTVSFSLVNESMPVSDVIQAAGYEHDHTLFVSSQFGDLSRLINLDRNPSGIPLVSASRINPATWVVQVSNAKAPFILVFGQAFNPNWRLYFGETGWLSSINSPSLDDRMHYLANGFANAWYVDRSGNFSVTIYFSPQSLVSIGIIISLLTSLGLLAWISYRIVSIPRGFWKVRNFCRLRTSARPEWE
jgi:hypothetical protein